MSYPKSEGTVAQVFFSDGRMDLKALAERDLRSLPQQQTPQQSASIH